MSETIRIVDYFYTSVDDRPGEGYRLLARLKRCHVNFLAFSASPCGPCQCQLNFFPEDHEALQRAAKEVNVTLNGPRKAFLIQGDDRMGALADTFRKFLDADVNLLATNCVSDNRGGYGMIIWVSPRDFEEAARALGVDTQKGVSRASV